jgi:hypothetical protein
MGIGGEVIRKAMFFRIMMNVIDPLYEIAVRIDHNALERFFEQTACALISFFNGFGVSVKKV